MHMRRVLLLLAGLATLAAITAGAAGASPAGQNGQILFGRFDPALDDTVIYTVDPDGTHVQQVLPFGLECPHWSPDGSRIATCGSPDGSATLIVNPDTGSYRELPMPNPDIFTACPVWSPDALRLACEGFGQTDQRLNGLYSIRSSDGGGLRRITSNPGGDDLPGSYSPSGGRFVFGRSDQSEDPVGLFVVNLHGSGLHRITPRGTIFSSPGDWSPKGNQIVFSRRVTADVHSSIWVVHADGTGLRRIRVVPASACGGPNDDPTAVGCFDPHWSPDGTMIVFGRGTQAGGRSIYTMSADGGTITRLTRGGDDESPDWGTHPLVK